MLPEQRQKKSLIKLLLLMEVIFTKKQPSPSSLEGQVIPFLSHQQPLNTVGNLPTPRDRW